jgi:3-dehydroquinate synthase
MEHGKNLLGATTQPKAVNIDIDFAKKLPEKQIKNGLAEVIKYGVIKDKSLFKFIERNLQKIIEKDEDILTKIIEKSLKIKIDIVKSDEKEKKGKRALLNYGHTYGHAIEKISNYKLLHGYAISIGMVMANKISVEKGLMKEKEAERIKNLLKKAGLPTTTINPPTKKDILSDKKKEGKHIHIILAKKIGKAIIVKEKCQ